MRNEAMKNHYSNPGLPGSFSGYGTFYRALKDKGIYPTKKELEIWLQGQDTYTLHRPKRKRFQRNKVIVAGIDDTWQADLVDMSNLTKYNSGVRYLITCIDVFSKFAWVVPLKNKSAEATTAGFEKIFESGRKPKHLQCDKGTEFFNAKLKRLLASKEINLYAVNSELKACIVERFNRTLKEKMYRYFTYKSSYKYIDVLDQFVLSYNNTYHRTIKMTPSKVNEENEKELWRKLYAFTKKDRIKYKFQLGDIVRISRQKLTFEKGYTPNWTEEIFTIVERIPRVPPVYKIRDSQDEILEGIFYEKELQKVIKEDDVYKINKIIKSRKVNGQLQYFVSWLGYPDSANSWIPASNVHNIQK